MKSKVLLILPVVCILVALIVSMVTPVFATALPPPDTQSGVITKTVVPEPGNPGWMLTTITVKNNNVSDPNKDSRQTYVIITDDVYHNVGDVEHHDLVGGVSGVLPFTLDPGETSVVYSWSWQVRPGEMGTEIMDQAQAFGYPTPRPPAPHRPYPITLSVPGYSTPLPELAAGILFGLGTLGLGGFIWIKRRKSASAV
jgi:hypothetical protein